MNSIKLSAYHRLYAFSDYQSMKAALPYMRRVVLAKRLDEVEESEARRFVGRYQEGGYMNYLGRLTQQRAKRSGTDSLITALQELFKSNGYSARYIAIERG
ncbi:hypothetical protein MKJ04_20880 [Pontibacter sp. E15-1]|uniref:hypothetical protein n=1 Tax=Pontibacter sp. E15-1 TaxID=2919918 RepID=UPI001F4F5A54|nr:hypothetical protein [Pontibacter sp. E15-1]MCJ8167308.1 hypothetical protein [Pontibacter sp. E15-1]